MSLEYTAAVSPQQPGDGGSATLAGSVRSGRRALSGVALTLTDQAGAQVARCSSGPDGQFEFPVVATGTYLVIAAVDGYQPHAQSLTVRQGSVASLEIVLDPAVGVYGVVYDQHTAEPVAAAVVTAISAAGEVLVSTVSEPDGSYRLVGLEATSVTLVAATTTAEPTATVVEFDAAGTVPQRRVDLAVAAPTSLSGTVTVRGEPVAGLALTLHDPTGQPVASTTTADDGSYRFDGLEPDTYTLRSHTSAPAVTPVAATTTDADVTLRAPC